MYTSIVFINQTNCLWKEYELILPTRTPCIPLELQQNACLYLNACLYPIQYFFLKIRCSN